MSKATATDRKVIVAPNHLRLGEFCEQYGGVFAGLVRGDQGKPDFYLFVPPGPEAETSASWGGYREEEASATSNNDGLANTIALWDSKIDHPAAKFARGLTLYGLDDYYLPSRNELRQCFINCPELFEKDWYWSSTQYSAHSAWVQGFYYGGQNGDPKGNDDRVRAVRRLLVIQ